MLGTSASSEQVGPTCGGAGAGARGGTGVRGYGALLLRTQTALVSLGAKDHEACNLWELSFGNWDYCGGRGAKSSRR
jgi:hypothetical protein